MNLTEVRELLISSKDPNTITIDVSKYMNHIATEAMNSGIVTDEVLEVLFISDILYNNSDSDVLPLEDGVYDLLFELVNKSGMTKHIGAPEIKLMNTNLNTDPIARFSPVVILDKSDMLFKDELYYNARRVYTENKRFCPVTYKEEDLYINKRHTNTEHKYPELVGTLLKSKFVLNCQAEERGVLNDSNVRVLERDFFQSHISKGILDPNRRVKMVLTIKYDGVSVEGECNSTIVSARSRGDAINNTGADMTPILGGYSFINALGIIPDNDLVGINFEAIIDRNKLYELNQLYGTTYKNCRTAIVGLISSSESYRFTDYITLVPLKSSLSDYTNRVAEIEFLNTYYANKERLRYTVIEGTYKELLFQIKKFVEEAESLRDVTPFMYDGVVVEYLDQDLRDLLGRKNAINMYAEAVKFNALKRQTVFLGYTYTVGQDGSITPMINYNPVEFFGTIHDKSTGHSYNRFKKLNLRIGDIIESEYVGDVMPYITKSENEHNRNNPNPIEQFVTHCPSCGSGLVLSDSGKTVRCNNKLKCPGILIARLVNMIDKLGIKDFGESHMTKIGILHFADLMELTLDKAKEIFPTDTMPYKLMDRIEDIKTKSLYDYQLVGSLGFTNMAVSNWKNILRHFTISELLDMSTEELYSNLTQIHNVGSSKADTIIDELPFFVRDLEYISNMPNVKAIKYNDTGKKIRFTGVRDSVLVEDLKLLGHDIGEGSVTKDTDLLIVPIDGHSSSKVTKAISYGIKVVPIQEFKNSIETYLE